MTLTEVETKEHALYNTIPRIFLSFPSNLRTATDATQFRPLCQTCQIESRRRRSTKSTMSDRWLKKGPDQEPTCTPTKYAYRTACREISYTLTRIQGIWYFATHKDLYKPLLSRIAPTLTLGTGITVAMFLFTYAPQVAVLFFTSGPIAALSAVLLVLSESSTLTMVLSKYLLIEDSLVDTFDGTLIAKGETALVAKDRQVKAAGPGEAIARLGKMMSKPFANFTPSGAVRYFMYLPLNFIPVVGTAMFVLLQGKKYGPTLHHRYFQLKGMSRQQQEKFVEERQGAYTRYVDWRSVHF
jgi:hypothetical protein